MLFSLALDPKPEIAWLNKTLNPIPDRPLTLNPKSYTQSPKPYTLNPKSYGGRKVQATFPCQPSGKGSKPSQSERPMVAAVLKPLHHMSSVFLVVKPSQIIFLI